jgi:hypothetical protein
MRSVILILVSALFAGCARGPSDSEPPKQEDGKIDLFKVGDKVLERQRAIGFTKLSEPEKAFFCVWNLEGEVYNGGFEQYYHNPSGDYAAEAVGALQAIGATETAMIVKRTNAIFGERGPSPDGATRQRQLIALSDASKKTMTKMDLEYVADSEKIFTLLETYVKANEIAFGRK